MKTKTRTNIILIAIGACASIAILVIYIKLHIVDWMMAVMTLLIFAAIMAGYFIMTKPGGRFPQDERIQKLWLRASNLSWGLTLYGVCILIFLDQIKVFSMTYQQLLAYLPMFMTYSMFIIRFILGRLGERSK